MLQRFTLRRSTFSWNIRLQTEAAPASSGFTTPSPPARVNAVVLGAGITGLVAAAIIAGEGSSVLVVDEYAHVGGNHIDRAIGGYTFDVGSLIFQDDSPLLTYFPELLPLYVPIEPTWSRINPQSKVTAYPLSVRDDILAAGPVEIARIVLSLAYCRMARRKIANARDFARFWIGARFLHRSGLERYMERFYGAPPERIDVRFAESRMMWLKENASFARLVRLWRRPAGMSSGNRQMVRPQAGYTTLYAAAVRRLEGMGVRFALGSKIRSVSAGAGSFEIALESGPVSCSRLVSAIPINRMRAACGLSPAELGTVTLLSLFFSFSGRRGFDSSVLYNFAHLGRWKRLTVYSDFYGLVDGREFFTAEVNVDPSDCDPVDDAERDFRAHAAANGLFDGDLRLEGTHLLSDAYPVYVDGASERAAVAIAELREMGVESFGRQGGFSYQPTARASTVEAKAAVAEGKVAIRSSVS